MQYLTVERALRKYIKLEFEKENITIPIPQLIVHTEGSMERYNLGSIVEMRKKHPCGKINGK